MEFLCGVIAYLVIGAVIWGIMDYRYPDESSKQGNALAGVIWPTFLVVAVMLSIADGTRWTLKKICGERK